MNRFNRIWAEAKVNGKSVRLLVDTGADSFYLFRPTAQRLNLSMTNVSKSLKGPEWADHFLGVAEQCQLLFLGKTVKIHPAVIEKRGEWEQMGDGLLGWPMLERNITEFGSATTNAWMNNLPKLSSKDTKGWMRVRIRRGCAQLILEIPFNGYTAYVLVDTGNPGGLCLPPRPWIKWKLAHPQDPLTLAACTSLYVSSAAAEESLTRQLPLGTIVLTDVPVMEDKFSPAEAPFDMVIGLAALARLDIIIDGKHSVAYLRPRTTPAQPYTHNRAGVVFFPRDLQSYDGIAHVEAGSPAYEAGVRDGDILMKFDGQWRTSWTEGPNDALCNRPAGTKLDFVLKRGDRMVYATVTLRDILTREPSPSTAQPIEIPSQK